MYNLSRVFFLSFGLICLALVPFFLGAVHFFDYIAFENFIVHLTMSKFVGYPIPEFLGSGPQDSLQENISKFENFFIGILSFYGLFLISLSYVKTPALRWKSLSLALGIPFLLSLLGLWMKFIQDDHIIGPFEKHQLFQFTYILIIITSICFFIGLRKPKVRRRIKRDYPQNRNAGPTQAVGTQTEIPSAESMLKDTNESPDEVAPEQDSEQLSPTTPDNDLTAENPPAALANEEDNIESEATSSDNVQDEESSNDSSMQLEANAEEEVTEGILPPIDSGMSLDDASSLEEPPVDVSKDSAPTDKSNLEAPSVNP